MDALPSAIDEAVVRARVHVRGRVTGVGFRPFVHVLAKRLGLAGWVAVDDEGVVIEVEGTDVRRFIFEVRRFAPPLARIDAVHWQPRPVEGSGDFEIRTAP